MQFRILFLCIATNCIFQLAVAQNKWKPDRLSIAYFGEQITHPGAKAATYWTVRQKERTFTSKRGKDRYRQHTLDLGIGLSSYYHKAYQLGLTLAPELMWCRTNQRGTIAGLALSGGYLRTFVPNTYSVSADGTVQRARAQHGHFQSSMQLVFGKDLRVQRELPWSWHVKPGVMRATAGFPRSTWYATLEFGLNLFLNKSTNSDG